MEDNMENINFEEVLDSEIDDIWDIFFPYMTVKKEKLSNPSAVTKEKSKPRRYLRFLTM